MDVANLILEYLKALAYPALIGMIVILFKKEISSILGGKVTAKYKDLSLIIERKEREIEAMEANYAEITSEVSNELKSLEDKPEWNGLDSKIGRVLALLRKYNINSSHHSILRYIRDNGGTVKKSEIIKEFAGPHQGMSPHEFEVRKESVKDSIEDLYKSGLIALSDDHKVKIHPWIANELYEKA